MSGPAPEHLIALDHVPIEDEVEILPDFPALVDGRTVWVTAVLERTAVVQPAPGQPKVLVTRSRCLVDPGQLRFGELPGRHAARRGRERARRNREATRRSAA